MAVAFARALAPVATRALALALAVAPAIGQATSGDDEPLPEIRVTADELRIDRSCRLVVPADVAYLVDAAGDGLIHIVADGARVEFVPGNACGVHLWWDEDAQLASTPWAAANGTSCAEPAARISLTTTSSTWASKSRARSSYGRCCKRARRMSASPRQLMSQGPKTQANAAENDDPSAPAPRCEAASTSA